MNSEKIAKKLKEKLFPTKTKMIEKKETPSMTSSEYQNFFKFHYEKLKDEHPNWNTKQISSISALLWKRFKKSTRKHHTPEDVQDIYNKIMSGKESFRESRQGTGLSEE